MNSTAFLGSFSLSTFPIGIGLTAAAHAHLCNRSLTKTEEQRKHYLVLQSHSKADFVSQTLLDLNSLSEMLELVNVVLMQFPESRPRLRHRHESRRLRAHTKDRRSDTIKHNNGRRRSSQEDDDKSCSEFHERGSSGITEAPIVKSDEEKNEVHHSRRTSINYLGESSSSGLRRYRNLRHSRQPREIHRSNRSERKYWLSVADLEQWSRTYKALRHAQEAYMKTALHRMSRTQPFYFTLQNNLAFSFIITMLRYVTSTEKFSTLFSRYVPRFYRLRSWFKWGSLSPPSPLYIPWGYASSSNQGVEQGLTSISSTSSGAGTNPRFSSSVSAAFALLPLAPALFVSGIHFLAAARAQWVISSIQKENRRQAQFARRLSVLSTFLSIREKRLAWLAREIREFEIAEAERQEEEEYEDLCEDINENGDEIHEGDEGNVEEIGKRTNNSQGTTVTAESATTTSTGRPVRPRYLAQDAHSRVYSMLQDERSNVWPQDQSQNRTSPGGGNGSQEGTAQGHRHRQSDFETRLFMFAFGPDLENMDLDLFLNSSRERRRILRLEFEGMRDELTLFRNVTIRTKH
ncbi:hypothetical protein BGX27_009014 [Mortierella sp. AM989]|nr:hypothetical protein BGX27_009014 [Mortierella sp. AM989]